MSSLRERLAANQASWPRTRKQPYTDRGIARLVCIRCGAPAIFQWQICSDGNVYRPLCGRCDVELNRLVLEFMGCPDAKERMALYLRRPALAGVAL